MQQDATVLANCRILLVDDNRDAADSMAMVLGIFGARVRVGRDGPEALEVFETFDPSVVLLDIGMPGMDGYEVARAIRQRFPERRTSIVALTGWGQADDRRRAVEAGFDHHMVKPVDIDVLKNLILSLDAGSSVTDRTSGRSSLTTPRRRGAGE